MAGTERGFYFLGYHFGPEGFAIAQKALYNFVERAIRLYEQGPGEPCDSIRLRGAANRFRCVPASAQTELQFLPIRSYVVFLEEKNSTTGAHSVDFCAFRRQGFGRNDIQLSCTHVVASTTIELFITPFKEKVIRSCIPVSPSMYFEESRFASCNMVAF